MHPASVQVITKNDNLTFTDYFSMSIQRNSKVYSYLPSYFNLDSNSAIIIFFAQICQNYKELINYLKKNEIHNVYFFLDDVFRSSVENSFNPITSEFIEIKKIKHIIQKAKIKKYKIYSCELVTKPIEDISLYYADLYLNDYIDSKKNYKLTNKSKLLYKISCFNNRRDVHRQAISLLLCNKKDTFLTINQHMDSKYLMNNDYFNLHSLDEDIIYSLIANVPYLEDNANNYLDPLNIKKNHLDGKIQNNNFTYNIIQNSFVNIVTETCFTSQNAYVSEKTIKPIICKKPFLILSTPRSLGYLKNIGFKTFDKWWDESYDNELDNAIRLQKVYRIAENILEKNIDELKIMLDEMSDVLEYNKLHLENISNYLLPKIEK